MYPRDHAVISASVTAVAAVLAGQSGLGFLAWVVIGAVAGVMIDVDHVMLAMVVKGRWRQGFDWFRRPHRALLSPDALLDDIEYPGLVQHRMLTHLILLAGTLVLLPVHQLVLPACIGLAAHILADLVWDVRTGTYRNG